MGKFERRIAKSAIMRLHEESLFTNRLKKDVEKGDVFLAIRKDTIHFYHAGGRLFEFKPEDGFKTHNKYASVFRGRSSQKYIPESSLKTVEPIQTFDEGYNRIKENCAHYAGEERASVSTLCRNFSYVNQGSDVVILDIEIGFPKQSGKEAGAGEEQVNKIDFLLYHKGKRRLRFFEVKLFVNGELWAKKGRTPKVVGQVQRYQKQIKKSAGEILDAYKNYIDGVNWLFSLGLPEPEFLDPHVPLLICGYDSYHEQGVRNQCKSLNSNIKSDCIGKIKNCSIRRLWERTS